MKHYIEKLFLQLRYYVIQGHKFRASSIDYVIENCLLKIPLPLIYLQTKSMSLLQASFSCINFQKILAENCVVNKERGKKGLSLRLSDFILYQSSLIARQIEKTMDN